MTTSPYTLTATLQAPLKTIQNLDGSTKVITQPTLNLPFNPNDLVFKYIMNKQTFDTYGGRVTQLLSVKIDSMTLAADAGSRPNLLAFFQGIKNMQEQQIQSRASYTLTIPGTVTPSMFADSSTPSSGNSAISFQVWLRDIQVGWDPTTVTYPFQLMMEVEDTSYKGFPQGYATLTDHLMNQALQDLFTGAAATGIGYSYASQYYSGSLPTSTYANKKNNIDPAASNTANGLTDVANITASQWTQLTSLGQGNAFSNVSPGIG